MNGTKALRREALRAAVEELEHLGGTPPDVTGLADRVALGEIAQELERVGAVATAQWDEDEPGWVVRVVDPRGQERLHLRLHGMDIDRFGPNSAGHRLIENGWMTYNCAHLAQERPAGWLSRPDGRWTAPVHVL